MTGFDLVEWASEVIERKAARLAWCRCMPRCSSGRWRTRSRPDQSTSTMWATSPRSFAGAGTRSTSKNTLGGRPDGRSDADAGRNAADGRAHGG